jgi:hypothetical protein
MVAEGYDKPLLGIGSSLRPRLGLSIRAAQFGVSAVLRPALGG